MSTKRVKSSRSSVKQLDLGDNAENKNDYAQGFEAPRTNTTPVDAPHMGGYFDRKYDLTPLDTSSRAKRPNVMEDTAEQGAPTTPSYSIDPWEMLSPTERETEEDETFFGITER
jgi:hypothetical protein